MSKEVKIEVKQREGLVELLRQARSREESELENRTPNEKDTIAHELLVEEGGDKLLEQMKQNRRKISALQEILSKQENELEDLGFASEDSSISLRWNAPSRIQEEFRKRLANIKKPHKTPLKKYDNHAEAARDAARCLPLLC